VKKKQFLYALHTVNICCFIITVLSVQLDLQYSSLRTVGLLNADVLI